MIDGWTPEAIERARARLEHDTDPTVVEAGRQARQAQAAAWGTPKRCKTGEVSSLGDCLWCGDENGVHARCQP